MFECVIRSGAAAACASLALCSGALAGETPLAVEQVLAAGNLQRPVYLTAAPGDTSRLFVVDRPGRIRIIKDGVLELVPFLDIDSKVFGGIGPNDEHGLLGLAFHPDYQNNGFFYVNYTANSDAQSQEDTIIERYTVSSDPDLASLNSAVTLLDIDQPFGNHNGGWIGFGPNDGYLYIAMGDGGNFCDLPGQNAQNLNNLLGAMLRIDVDNQDPGLEYAIPADNPFVDVAGADEIWSYGLRNPFRCSFDRATGDLYMGDVGQDAREEVNYQPMDSMGGENYGWSCMEGFVCSSASGCPTSACVCNSPDLILPIHDYPHPGTGACSVIGGYVYRGCAIPDLQGSYWFTDFCNDDIFTFEVVDGMMTNLTERTAELDPPGFDAINDVVSFGEDNDGEIYIVENGGQIWKIVAEDGSNGCDDCAADCNGDGAANILDFTCFQALFSAGSLDADCNGDGSLNILDFTCFQAQFAACG